MAKKTAKSNLSLGSGFRKSFNQHRGEDVLLRTGATLPPDIEGGIAEVSTIEIGHHNDGDNKGKPYFMIRGVVVEPKDYAGIQESFVFEPLYDTPGRSRETEDEHVAHMIGVLQAFGVETKDVDAEQVEDGSLFGSMLAKDGGLYLRYRTWKGNPTPQYPNPRTNITFVKGCEYSGEENSHASAVEDETEEEPAQPEEFGTEIEQLAAKAEKNDSRAQAKLTEMASEAGVADDAVEEAEDWYAVAKLIEEAEAEPSDEGEEGEDDLDALGEAADDDDEEAQQRLSELAEAAGEDPDEYETWTELATALSGEEGEPFVPEKDQVVNYKPPKAKKAVECQVTAVFKAKETCNLKSLDDDTPYKGVSWSQLSEAADIAF